MSPRVAIAMALSGVLVLLVGVMSHAPAPEVAMGALVVCLASGIGMCVLEDRRRR